MVLNRATAAAVIAALTVFATPAAAQRLSTRDALDRLEEILEMRLEDGVVRKADLLPALVVSTQVRYEESQGWYATKALSTLTTVLGTDNLRLCEACMRPRLFTKEGLLEHNAGPVSLDEIIRLDESARGTARPARTAIWLDEHASGVSLKIVDLSTARVVLAENVDPSLQETTDTEGMFRLSRELERRARGEGLTQAFVDISFFPSQHFSLDWTDQWGETNANFTGVSLSLFDPILGVGVGYYRVIDVFKIGSIRIAPQAGGKVIMSLPTAIIRGLGEDVDDIVDPLLTAVLVIRVPFGGSNYGAIATISTNGRIGFGISLLNFSLLPVIP